MSSVIGLRRPGVPGENGSARLVGVLMALVGAALLVAVLLVAVLLTPAGWLRPGTDDPDDPLAYEFMRTHERTGQPVVWDPCLPIHLVVNSAHAPDGADVLLAEAITRVNAASGLRLEVVGQSSEQPDLERTDRELRSGRAGTARAPVLLAWTTPEALPRLKGSVAGVGGPVTQFGNAADRTRYFGGSVYLDAPQIQEALGRRDGHAAARAIVMHELGHLVGLAHVDNDRQLMAAKLHRGVTEFAMGDRAGLRRLGSGGCPYAVG